MQVEKEYISKKEACTILRKSIRQVDRYAKEENWRFIYLPGSSKRREKFYHIEDVRRKAEELESALDRGIQKSYSSALVDLQRRYDELQRELRELKERVLSVTSAASISELELSFRSMEKGLSDLEGASRGILERLKQVEENQLAWEAEVSELRGVQEKLEGKVMRCLRELERLSLSLEEVEEVSGVVSQTEERFQVQQKKILELFLSQKQGIDLLEERLGKLVERLEELEERGLAKVSGEEGAEAQVKRLEEEVSILRVRMGELVGDVREFEGKLGELFEFFSKNGELDLEGRFGELEGRFRVLFKEKLEEVERFSSLWEDRLGELEARLDGLLEGDWGHLDLEGRFGELEARLRLGLEGEVKGLQHWLEKLLEEKLEGYFGEVGKGGWRGGGEDLLEERWRALEARLRRRFEGLEEKFSELEDWRREWEDLLKERLERELERVLDKKGRCGDLQEGERVLGLEAEGEVGSFSGSGEMGLADIGEGSGVEESHLRGRYEVPLSFSERLECCAERMYWDTEYRQNIFVKFLVFLGTGIWIFLLRVYREVSQTAGVLWYWMLGYMPVGYSMEGGEGRITWREVREQIWDIFKFLWLVVPLLYFLQRDRVVEASYYFVGFLFVHFILSWVGRILGWEWSLLPSAWREIRRQDYRFRRPFLDLVRLLAFISPVVYFCIQRQWYGAVLYGLAYLGLHFVINRVSRRLGYSWSLLPPTSVED